MLLYLLTFVCFFFPATVDGKDESFDNYQLPKFHQNLQSFSKRPMIANSELGNAYVLAKSFANKDCNSDGGQLFESMAILSGYCVVLDVNTAQRWTCDSSTVHVEKFAAADCDDRHRTVDSYIHVGQCFFPNSTDTAPYNGVSYGCSSTFVPKGSWLTSLYFSDNDCEKPVQGFSVLNGYCLSGDQKTSYRFDNPKENFYFNSGNCTGAVESIDTSSWMNVCFPLSPPVGLAN
eukprot:gene6533-7033_t